MSEEILILNQLTQMSAALFAGFFAGISYHAYSACIHKGINRRKHPLAYLKTDAVFAVVLTVVLLMFWFQITDGSLRVMVFFWFALGFVIYFTIFKKRFINKFSWVKKWKFWHFVRDNIKKNKKEHQLQEKALNLSADFIADKYQRIHCLEQKMAYEIRKRLPQKDKDDEEM